MSSTHSSLTVWRAMKLGSVVFCFILFNVETKGLFPGISASSLTLRSLYPWVCLGGWTNNCFGWIGHWLVTGQWVKQLFRSFWETKLWFNLFVKKILENQWAQSVCIRLNNKAGVGSQNYRKGFHNKIEGMKRTWIMKRKLHFILCPCIRQ